MLGGALAFDTAKLVEAPRPAVASEAELRLSEASPLAELVASSTIFLADTAAIPSTVALA